MIMLAVTVYFVHDAIIFINKIYKSKHFKKKQKNKSPIPPLFKKTNTNRFTNQFKSKFIKNLSTRKKMHITIYNNTCCMVCM